MLKNKQHQRLLAVCVVTLVVVVLLSLLEPGYSQICDFDRYSRPENCAPHNVVYVAIWHLGHWIDSASPALTAVATIVIGIFTWTLWRSGETTAAIADRANEHFRVTERAYVKMSHETPTDGPALQWNAASNGFRVVVEIKNHGRTPAKITDTLLTYHIVLDGDDFPDPAPYMRQPDAPGRIEAFLVCNDSFKAFGRYTISPDLAARVGAKSATLIFYGYVDYIDQFGKRHRGGYGREYVLGNARNNLAYPNIASLNYDRVRGPGEGQD